MCLKPLISFIFTAPFLAFGIKSEINDERASERVCIYVWIQLALCEIKSLMLICVWRSALTQMAFLFGGKQMDPRRARYKFGGEMKNSQLMMPDWCAVYIRECLHARSRRANLISREQRVSHGFLSLLLLVCAPRIYTYTAPRVLCDGQIFIQKAVILHNLPRFM